MQDLPKAQRMKDEGVLAQITTLIAGHKTTSIAVARAVYALTHNKQAQTKLGQEGQKGTIDSGTSTEINQCGGGDSTEFKPERWANTPDVAASVPGVWSNILTFIGGPRACIGYRFSLLEIKTLVFTINRTFE
ncbi:hypothetical protein BYT27DRAFT_7209964 [Phlegmacium glaucopus]|nr:hypothetical protein BYT27DRAFT_7209964 [Phlegmacium glaucopus]